MSIRVCVVGGGTGGLEGLLSAHAQLGSKVELTLIAPDREFRYRPMSAASLFAPADERGLPITDVVAQTHATWVVDRVAAVHEAQGTLLSRDGDEVEFDFLLLALGARSERTLRQGHIWMRGSDPHFLDQILADVSAGRVRSVAVVVPRGARWPVPGYELALILAWTAGATGARCRVALITAEGRPLAALGHEAADTVFGELESAGVEVTTGVEVMDEESSDPAAPGPARIVLGAQGLWQRAHVGRRRLHRGRPGAQRPGRRAGRRRSRRDRGRGRGHRSSRGQPDGRARSRRLPAHRTA